MAVKDKIHQEIARAAILATHSAATLIAGSQRRREACRLLRSAEALSRAALATILAAPPPKADPAAVEAGSRPKKARNKKKKDATQTETPPSLPVDHTSSARSLRTTLNNLSCVGFAFKQKKRAMRRVKQRFRQLIADRNTSS